MSKKRKYKHLPKKPAPRPPAEAGGAAPPAPVPAGEPPPGPRVFESRPPAPLRVGDSVVVRPGVKDSDLGGDIGGWQGRVVEMDEGKKYSEMVCIEWDSLTLRQIPGDDIQRCEEQGMDWTRIWLGAPEVEAANPRDTPADVAQAQAELADQSSWLYLGEQGRRIQQVLAGVHPDDDRAAARAWARALGRYLVFPFAAQVAEVQEWGGPLQAGDRVTVRGIAGLKAPYGVFVRVEHLGRALVFPLCDLEARDLGSSNHQWVDDYATWFANQ